MAKAGAHRQVLQTLARRRQAMQRDYFRALQEIRNLREAREEAAMFGALRPEPVEKPESRGPQPENRVRFEKPVSTPPQPRRAPENLALRL